MGGSKRGFLYKYMTVANGFRESKREHELHAYLKETLMLRRLKADVMDQLPPIERTLVPIVVSKASMQATLTQWGKADILQLESDEQPTFSCETEEDKTKPPAPRQLAALAKFAEASPWLAEQVIKAKQCGEKLVIFAHHRLVVAELQKLIHEHLDKDMAGSVCLDGRSDQGLRHDMLRRFQTDPNCVVALVSITAAGIGVNGLQAARLGIFVELPDTAEWLLQAEARLHRNGQRGHVQMQYLIGSVTSSHSPAASIADFFYWIRRGDTARWRELQSSQRAISGVLDRNPSQAKDMPALSPAASDAALLNLAQKLTQVTQFQFEVSDTGLTHIYACDPGTHKGHHTGLALWPSELDDSSICPQALCEAKDFYDAHGELQPWLQQRLRGKPIILAELGPAVEEIQKLRVQPSGSTERIAQTGHPTDTECAAFQRAKAEGAAVWICAEVLDNTTKSMVPYAQAYCVQSGQLLCVNCFVKLDMGARQVPSRREMPLPSNAEFLRTYGDFVESWQLRHRLKSDLFCGGSCLNAYQLKRSSSRLRQKLYKAERAVCRHCRVDCDHVLLRLQLTHSSEERLRILNDEMQTSMNSAMLALPGGCEGTIARLCREPSAGVIWQCDHICEVRDGGGQASDLAEVQTLCIFCHLMKTHSRLCMTAEQSKQSAYHGNGSNPTKLLNAEMERLDVGDSKSPARRRPRWRRGVLQECSSPPPSKFRRLAGQSSDTAGTICIDLE
eukprot:TRINITY_DN40798_c0_g1_i1.p1 TRINITY_DN40798_c0_g1~~TRINITY_DN40798_c0_g1_i1.p1  ORF type:complete len:850 (-),score=127.04 TRINITY_DN40798_c0_g1_i1:109-2301(-)